MQEAIVVGAGPTAPMYYEWIKASRLPVITVSTMLRPLQAAKIYPEVTCIIDASAIMVLHFVDADTSGELVYGTGVASGIVREWNGPICAVVDLPGSSVLHLAIDVAMAETTHLVGADFCYLGGQSHAVGVVTRYELGRKECIKEVNGYGKEVLTSRDLVGYRKELEDYIERHPGRRFIKHGHHGLAVRGAEWADDPRIRI